jgi:hypothetical protein
MRATVALSATLIIIFLLACFPASAQNNRDSLYAGRVTCTGVLIDAYVKPHINAQRDWPLAIIYDAGGNYTCVIDRSGMRHDPLRSCHAGEKCRVVGLYERRIKSQYAETYLIGSMISIDWQGDLEK